MFVAAIKSQSDGAELLIGLEIWNEYFIVEGEEHDSVAKLKIAITRTSIFQSTRKNSERMYDDN